MKAIILALLLSTCVSAYAADRMAVSRIDKNVNFTITDKECTEFPNIPDVLLLKQARAYDSYQNQTIYGCALDYGTQIEFQLISPDKTKHWQFILPTSDFYEVLPI